MAQVNRRLSRSRSTTYEGGPARTTTSKEDLERIALTAMLWEDTFYESGSSIAKRLVDTIHSTDPKRVCEVASKSRNEYGLRHVPLLMARELCRHKRKDEIKVSGIIHHVINRPDELAEFVSIYWQDGRKPLSAQAKKGLAEAFRKFNAYALAKYNRDKDVKLRDVLFLCHAKPKDKEQEQVWKKLVEGTLDAPDTWEVALSAGADKKATWERLISEQKLGGLATLRNLRNMEQAGLKDSTIRQAISQANYKLIFPYRFIAAAKYAPRFEPDLEPAMLSALEGFPRLTGKTLLLVDISGSMSFDTITRKSEITRADAACGLAIMARELCDDVEIGAFHNSFFNVPPRRGFALRDAIRSFGEGGTYLGAAINRITSDHPDYDRLVVFTDEQAHDRVVVTAPMKGKKNYMVNVAAYNKTVNTSGEWINVSGFSEQLLRYIALSEGLDTRD